LNQQLWLGIQLKAPQRLKNLFSKSSIEAKTPDDLASQFWPLCQQLATCYHDLETNCLLNNITPPRILGWIAELQMARRNIYQLKHSRLRRFLRRLEQAEDVSMSKQLADLACSYAELLCLLPNNTLNQFIDFQQSYEQLPTAQEIVEWLVEMPGSKSWEHTIKQYVSGANRINPYKSGGFGAIL